MKNSPINPQYQEHKLEVILEYEAVNNAEERLLKVFEILLKEREQKQPQRDEMIKCLTS